LHYAEQLEGIARGLRKLYEHQQALEKEEDGLHTVGREILRVLGRGLDLDQGTSRDLDGSGKDNVFEGTGQTVGSRNVQQHPVGGSIWGEPTDASWEELRVPRRHGLEQQVHDDLRKFGLGGLLSKR